MPSDQSRIIEQAKLKYPLIGKASEKQIKTNQRIKQAKPLKSVKPKEHKENIKSVEEILSKEMITNEIKNEIDKTKT